LGKKKISDSESKEKINIALQFIDEMLDMTEERLKEYKKMVGLAFNNRVLL